MFKKLILLIGLVASLNAAYVDSNNREVKLISVMANKFTLIQTEPRHSIENMNCTNDYWAILDYTRAGYNEMLSLLISAKVSKSKVTIRVTDDMTSEFCRIERIILE